MAEIRHIKIDELIPDDRNANAGTARGRGALERSLSNYGAGRSILIDKNNKIIAGNSTTECAYAIGLEDVIVVETDGNQLVAVRRRDLSLDDDPKARQLSFCDNRIGELNLSWDIENLLVDKDLLAETYLWNDKELELLQDGLDLLQVEAADDQPADCQQGDKSDSDSVTFQVKLSVQQRDRLYEAINTAKSRHNLRTVAEALSVIVEDYLG